MPPSSVTGREPRRSGVAVPESSMASVPPAETVTKPVAPAVTPAPLTLNIEPVRIKMVGVNAAPAFAARFTVVPPRMLKVVKAGRAFCKLIVPPPRKLIEFVEVHTPEMFSVAPEFAPMFVALPLFCVIGPDHVFTPARLWITPPLLKPLLLPFALTISGLLTVTPPGNCTAAPTALAMVIELVPRPAPFCRRMPPAFSVVWPMNPGLATLSARMPLSFLERNAPGSRLTSNGAVSVSVLPATTSIRR